MQWLVNPDEEILDWKAVCGKTARTVWREGRLIAFPTPIPANRLRRVWWSVASCPKTEKYWRNGSHEQCHGDGRQHTRPLVLALANRVLFQAAQIGRPPIRIMATRICTCHCQEPAGRQHGLCHRLSNSLR